MSFDIDLSDVRRVVREAQSELTRGTRDAVRKAARDGIAEAVRSRRYQNRTGDLSGEAVGRVTDSGKDGAEGEMVWPVDYASYVDSKAELGFTDTAEKVAAEVLQEGCDKATDGARAALEG